MTFDAAIEAIKNLENSPFFAATSMMGEFKVRRSGGYWQFAVDSSFPAGENVFVSTKVFEHALFGVSLVQINCKSVDPYIRLTFPLQGWGSPS